MALTSAQVIPIKRGTRRDTLAEMSERIVRGEKSSVTLW
jgi:hypothetical protein